jgi:hypothetical protein
MRRIPRLEQDDASTRERVRFLRGPFPVNVGGNGEAASALQLAADRGSAPTVVAFVQDTANVLQAVAQSYDGAADGVFPSVRSAVQHPAARRPIVLDRPAFPLAQNSIPHV